MEGKRPRGRGPKRWSDEIAEELRVPVIEGPIEERSPWMRNEMRNEMNWWCGVFLNFDVIISGFHTYLKEKLRLLFFVIEFMKYVCEVTVQRTIWDKFTNSLLLKINYLKTVKSKQYNLVTSPIKTVQYLPFSILWIEQKYSDFGIDFVLKINS